MSRRSKSRVRAGQEHLALQSEKRSAAACCRWPASAAPLAMASSNAAVSASQRSSAASHRWACGRMSGAETAKSSIAMRRAAGSSGMPRWAAVRPRTNDRACCAQLEVETVAAALVVDLHQQVILAGTEGELHLILVWPDAARNVVGPNAAGH